MSSCFVRTNKIRSNCGLKNDLQTRLSFEFVVAQMYPHISSPLHLYLVMYVKRSGPLVRNVV
jgi:hypothetical protein